MRKSISVFIALAVLAAGGAAWAADSNTLTVQASVTGTCKFVAPKTSTLDFGALDPANAIAVNGTATPQFWCTKGVTTDAIVASLGSNPVAGVRQLKDTAGTDLIPYTLALATSGTNLGPGTPRTLTVTGTIAAGSYTAVAASSYSDTVTLTLTP